MTRARAVGVSGNRITLLRDPDGDGVAEICSAFLENLNLHVGNTDGIVSFPYVPGASRITSTGRKLTAFKALDIGPRKWARPRSGRR
jgi:glucose/arabinose dehydrogenase